MEEIDLKELFNIFWNKKIQIVLIIVVFTIIGVVYSFGFVKPKYSSSTTLVLAMSSKNEKEGDKKGTSITTTDMTLNSNLVPTYSELIKSNNIMREVIKNLEIDEDEDILKKCVSVSSVQETEVIKITVTYDNAKDAANIANEIAKAFSNKINEIYKINNIYIVDIAEVDEEPTNINHIKDAILFMFVGFAISIAYVFVLNMLDTTVKAAEDIENAYKIPVLVSVPTIENFGAEERGGRKK